ncbi:MAG: TIGR02266 family protein [Myxococcota bacterium]|jgi:type IV pilus assembly protein PilZ|nr:TIGR02266 family protein [Myxococcota bacterium]
MESEKQGGSAEVERRKSVRSDVSVRVEYRTVDQFFTDFARNINEGGLFVGTENLPPVGTRVALQFELPGGGEPVKVTGIVVRKSDGPGGEPAGMGIEFEELAPADRLRINELVRNLRTAASDSG